MQSGDEFLNLLRQNPGEGFARSLYAHLNNQLRQRRRRNTLLSASVIATLSLMLAAMSVPEVRASVLSTLREVAGIQFEVTSEYPGGGSVTEIPQTAMALDLARSEFDLSLPAWAPQGYAIDETVQIGEWDGGNQKVTVTWNGPGTAAIQLEVSPNEYALVVGPESVGRIEVAGRDVALWRGGWSYDERRWDPTIPTITLSWSDDGITAYHLMGMLDSVSLDELLRMVQSIP
jgi:hypothetical protein